MRSLVDCHAHLHEITTLETAIENAQAAGIGHIVAVGMDLSSNQKTLEIARRFPDIVLPALGYHPWRLKDKEVDENLAFIKTHLKACVALGEIGWIIKSR